VAALDERDAAQARDGVERWDIGVLTREEVTADQRHGDEDRVGVPFDRVIEDPADWLRAIHDGRVTAPVDDDVHARRLGKEINRPFENACLKDRLTSDIQRIAYTAEFGHHFA